jgi:hypothetical protein
LGSNLIINASKKIYSGIKFLNKSKIMTNSYISVPSVKKEFVTDIVSLSKNPSINLSNYSPEINLQFQKFVSILKLRNPQMITNEKRYSKIVDYIFNNHNYISEKDLYRHLKYLTDLAGKKAPNGKFLLNGKTFRYLANFKENGLSTQRLREYGDLIYCAEIGAIHPRALEKFNIANGVNPEILRDIEKIKLAKKSGKNLIDVFIPEFESIIKNSNEIAKLQPGDLFSIKGEYMNGLYYITGKNKKGGNQLLLIGSSEKRNIIFQLMPPVSRFFVKQGGSGTCYQLAAYISMFKQPKFMSDILSRVTEQNGKLMIKMPNGSTPDNLFAGKFEDFSSFGYVRTYLENGKFKPVDSSQSATTNHVVKAMETLYGKHRKYTAADEFVKNIYKYYGKDKAKLAYKKALANMDKYVYIKDENSGNFIVKTLQELNNEQIKQNKKIFKTVEDYYKEGGNAAEIYRYFSRGYNGDVETTYTFCSSTSNTLNEIRNKLKMSNAVHSFGTRSKGSNREYVLNAGKDLYSNHAYCVQSYNPKTDVVTYINPWNSTLTYDMKLEELAKNITHLDTFTKT